MLLLAWAPWAAWAGARGAQELLGLLLLGSDSPPAALQRLAEHLAEAAGLMSSSQQDPPRAAAPEAAHVRGTPPEGHC